MVRRPARGAVVGATVMLTVPLPTPDAPEVTVIQSASLTAVQGQPWSVLTATLKAPPAAPTLWFAGASVQVQTEARKFAVWSAPRFSKAREGGSKEKLSLDGVTT